VLFSHKQITSEQHAQTRYLFLWPWPWPWPDDLDVRTWPTYSEDVPACQK